MITLSSPVTGLAQTGLTSPTYTVVSDVAPAQNGKAYAVTALGGTQTGVSAHSVSNPFTLTFWRPLVYRLLGRLNANGILIQNPSNVHKIITRKGVIPLAGQSPQTAICTTIVEVPAGAESVDPNSVRAMISCHLGGLSQLSAGIGDTVVTGIV